MGKICLLVGICLVRAHISLVRGPFCLAVGVLGGNFCLTHGRGFFGFPRRGFGASRRGLEASRVGVEGFRASRPGVWGFRASRPGVSGFTLSLVIIIFFV